MTSKVEHVEITDDAIIVFVSHEPGDSFTRSVDRAVRKVWRARAGNDERLAVTSHHCARYAHTQLDNGRWISTTVCTSSWNKGYAVLDQLYGPKRPMTAVSGPARTL